MSTGKTYTNSIGMVFVEIPAGHIFMPDPPDERPVYSMHITQAFFLGKYPVTQEEWVAVMDNNPSSLQAADLPVGNVLWEDIQEFIRRLHAREGHERYRLPAETEWEYACRAGSTTAYCFGDNAADLDAYAWYVENTKGPKPVGRKLPNAWGLHDMHGNVLERVQTGGPPLYGSSAYQVFKGGSCCKTAHGCRSVERVCYGPGGRPGDEGFRLLLAPEKQISPNLTEPGDISEDRKFYTERFPVLF